jgi:hypothetical protein
MGYELYNILKQTFQFENNNESLHSKTHSRFSFKFIAV